MIVSNKLPSRIRCTVHSTEIQIAIEVIPFRLTSRVVKTSSGANCNIAGDARCYVK